LLAFEFDSTKAVDVIVIDLHACLLSQTYLVIFSLISAGWLALVFSSVV